MVNNQGICYKSKDTENICKLQLWYSHARVGWKPRSDINVKASSKCVDPKDIEKN